MKRIERFRLTGAFALAAVVVALGAAVVFQTGMLDTSASNNVEDEAYQAAADAYVRCVEEAIPGVEVRALPSALGSIDFEFTYPAERTGTAPGSIQDCRQEHFDAVDLAHSMAPSTEEQEELLQAARDALAACFREAGIDAPEHPAPSELTVIDMEAGSPESLLHCRIKIQEEFQLPGFGG